VEDYPRDLIEFEARLPFTSPYYQAVGVALLDSIARDRTNWTETRNGPMLLLSGEDTVAELASGDRRWRLPRPRDAERWHVYAFQLGPEGRIGWFVDGELAWSSATPAVRAMAGRRYLALYGRSLEVELAVGEVRVYTGPLYRPAGVDLNREQSSPGERNAVRRDTIGAVTPASGGSDAFFVGRP